MKEIAPDLRSWRERGDEHAVVATLVGARGSAPRPVGSRLAISERGELAGSVSGGCVESEVAELASEVLASGEARSVTYGISDEQAFSVGLPCGGRDRRSPRAGRARRPRAVPGREPIPPARVRRRRPRRGALQGGERAGLGDDRRRPAAAFRDPRADPQHGRATRRVEEGLSEDEIDRIAGPTGLDVGAETPTETAVSILAEILAVRCGRPGGRLKDGQGRIHAELQSK